MPIHRARFVAEQASAIAGERNEIPQRPDVRLRSDFLERPAFL